MSRLGDTFTRKAGGVCQCNARYDITWTDGITIIIMGIQARNRDIGLRLLLVPLIHTMSRDV